MSWADRPCKGLPITVFFPKLKNGLRKNRPVDEYALAKKYCGRCPLVEECLARELQEVTDQNDIHGFRAGMTEDERRAVRFRYRKSA